MNFGTNLRNIHLATPGEKLHMHQVGAAKRALPFAGTSVYRHRVFVYSIWHGYIQAIGQKFSPHQVFVGLSVGGEKGRQRLLWINHFLGVVTLVKQRCLCNEVQGKGIV